jgi:hypothetical protein
MKTKLGQFMTVLLAASFLLFAAATAEEGFGQETGKSAQAVEVDIRNGGGPGGWGRDADGDGIPNGRDDDYDRRNRMRDGRMEFVDENGDGINDRCRYGDGYGSPRNRLSSRRGPGYGPGDMYMDGRHRDQGRGSWGGGHGGGTGGGGGTCGHGRR